MIEPLTKSRPEVSFSGKSFSNHPHWSNEPLRLTEKQRKDPISVFNEFFQCYHLKETRELLWNWLTEAVSSSRSVSNDPHDRSNQFYFYEKIEELIEAALLIAKSPGLNKHGDSARDQVENKKEDEEIPFKPKPLIEYAESDPIYVLKQVFTPYKDSIIEEIKEWLKIGLSSDDTLYDDGEQRSNLISLHDHLIVLTEALYVIALKYVDEPEINRQLSAMYILTELSISQREDPKSVLVDFFEKYNTKYVKRELDDWYEASISFSGEWRGNVVCLQQIWDIYRNVQCLIKSAEQLLKHTSVISAFT